MNTLDALNTQPSLEELRIPLKEYKETIPQASPPKPIPPKPSAYYVVKSGDTLSAIASRNHTTVAALKRANGLSSDTIRVGQRLKIP
jgi:LysM repeat protein